MKDILQSGWALAWWCGEGECEATVKDETKATTRNIPLDQPGGTGRCIHCGKPARERALWARAY
jgi:prolyl-tRNA synthetase